jgi:cytochrome b561
VVHQLIGLAIACLVAAHIGAALYHHFVRKDGVLMRMIEG